MLLIYCTKLGANSSLLVSLGGWFRPVAGKAPYNKLAVEAAKAATLKNCSYLEACLADKTFLVGHRVTIADIFVASCLCRGFENVSFYFLILLVEGYHVEG